MIKYKSYTFTHLNSATPTEIDLAYQTALDLICTDFGGTPITTQAYKKGSDWYVTIVYKSAT